MSMARALWNLFFAHKHASFDGTQPIETAGLADGAVTSAKILDGTIVNADVSASAAIDLSKIANSVNSTEMASGTPVLKGASTAGSFTYALQKGRYARVGPVVVFTFTLNVSSVDSGPGGAALVTLPVQAVSQSNLYGACAIEISNVNLSAGYTYVTGRISPSGNDLGLFENGDGVSIQAIDSAVITASFQVLGTVVYLAA